MMGLHYFSIIEERNDLPYAKFCLKIKWNVAAIAGYESANGYIVQEINYTDATGSTGACDDYYEAWPVCNGVCDSGSKIYDDAFQSSTLTLNPLYCPIGKESYTQYKAKVYWVDRMDDLYAEIDTWEPYSVIMAGHLQAKYVKDCPAFHSHPYIFTREFVHRFDCRSDEMVEASLRDYFAARITQNDSELREVLQHVLGGTRYEHLVDKICAKQSRDILRG